MSQSLREQFIRDYSTYCWSCDDHVQGEASVKIVLDRVEIEIGCPGCLEVLTDCYQWTEQEREKRT